MDRQTVIGKTGNLIGKAATERGVEPLQVYVELAVDEFNRFAKPRELEQTITGDGGDEYALDSEWDDDFSTLVDVVYWPSNDTDSTPTRVSLTDVQVEKRLPSDGGSQIRFLSISPSSSDRVVVTFTALHTLGETAATTTIPASLAIGLAYLAGSMALNAAAAGTAATVPQSGDADIVGSTFGTAGDAYRRLATEFSRKADELLGISRSGEGAVGRPAMVSKRAIPGRARGRRPYLTHGSRRYLTHEGW